MTRALRETRNGPANSAAGLALLQFNYSIRIQRLSPYGALGHTFAAIEARRRNGHTCGRVAGMSPTILRRPLEE